MYICNIVANFTLAKRSIIQRSIAALLMLVFSLSITPTIVLHNWVADHTDAVRKFNDGSSDQVGTQKIYCHCDHIVAESPFTGTEAIRIAVPEKIFTPEPGQAVVSVTASARYYFSLRGPPAV